MSCNCTKCNNKPCGCQDDSLKTPCSYTNCGGGTTCSEIICDECVIHCGESFQFCAGGSADPELLAQIKDLQKQIDDINQQLAKYQAEYDSKCVA